MYRYTLAFFTILTVLLSACGSKTLPKTKSQIELSLPVITDVKANFKGGQLVLKWTMPAGLTWLGKAEEKADRLERSKIESAGEKNKQSEKISEEKESQKEEIEYLRLNIRRKEQLCTSCNTQDAFSMKFNSSTILVKETAPVLVKETAPVLVKKTAPVLVKKTGVSTVDHKQPVLTFQDDSYILKFPEYFYNQFLSEDGTYLTLDYKTIDGMFSSESNKITFKRPVSIAMPNIKFRVEWLKKGDSFSKKGIKGDQKVARKRMKLLYLTWTPIEKKGLYTIEPDGKVRQEKKYFGINFYYINRRGEMKPINSTPKYEGSFLILNFYFPLYATSVDRFGNESKRVLVYKEKRK